MSKRRRRGRRLSRVRLRLYPSHLFVPVLIPSAPGAASFTLTLTAPDLPPASGSAPTWRPVPASAGAPTHDFSRYVSFVPFPSPGERHGW
jgi:hypothetical protein